MNTPKTSRHSRLTIAIDGCLLAAPLTGIGTYIHELCKALDKQLPSARFLVLTNRPPAHPMPSSRWSVLTGPGALTRLPSVVWLKLVAPSILSRHAPDFFWATRTLAPQVPKHTKLISTVHDLNHLIVPETMPLINRLSHKLWFARDLRRVDAIACVSEGTAARLSGMVGIEADGVVTPAVDPIFRPQPQAEVTSALRSLGIEGPYFLTVGTREPRKRLALTLQAFALAKRNTAHKDLKLVTVGADGWKQNGIAPEDACSDSVLSLGYVPREVLPALYTGCAALIFPSIYEGFGMPVAEARACGARVITTDTPELREAGDSHTKFINPTSDTLARAMEECLSQARSHTPPAMSAPQWEDSASRLCSIGARTLSANAR